MLGPSPQNSRRTQPREPWLIIAQEAQKRRDEGLYYYCDEKFTPGHRCDRPQLFMMEDSSEAALEDENEQQFNRMSTEDIFALHSCYRSSTNTSSLGSTKKQIADHPD